MSYKTIIVSLNDISRSETLLTLATGMAAKHEAHLIGLYVIPAPRIYPAVSAHVTPIVLNETKTFFEEKAEQSRNAFEKAASAAGVEAEWRRLNSDSPNIADGVIEHGLQADVLLISQRNDLGNDGIEPDFCERVVMESGRPVIVVPHNGKFNEIGEHVVVGWNASREATRAVFDAMPMLESSEETRLIWVDPQKQWEKSGNLPGAEMAATLTRHGVRSIAEAMPTDGIGSGDALLNRASDLGADLIVMGAYGHTRLREFVFGGATRTMLDQMTLPVLLSH
jgi:nucleotide-binding universal stress UspA family protein